MVKNLACNSGDRDLEWVAISFSQNFPDSGFEPASHLAGGFFTTESSEKPK